MPTHEQDRRKPTIKQDKGPAIIVRKPDATMEPASHEIQLMSKHPVLSFKPQLRLDGEASKVRTKQNSPDHSTDLGDSIASSTRIRFRYTQACRCDGDRYCGVSDYSCDRADPQAVVCAASALCRYRLRRHVPRASFPRTSQASCASWQEGRPTLSPIVFAGCRSLSSH